MSDVVRDPAVETLEAARGNAERQERALKVSFGEREPVEPGLHTSAPSPNELLASDLYVTEESDATAADKEPLGYITSLPLGPAVPVPMIQPRANYLFGWSRGDLRRGALLLITACVVAVFLYHVQAILPPFLIAFGLAALLDPTLRYNEQRGRSRVYSILMLYLFALSLLVFLVIWVIPSIITQVTDISSHLSHYYLHISTTINGYMSGHEHLLKMMGVKQKSVGDFFETKSGPVQAHIGAVLGSVSGLAQALLARVIWLVIIPVASFFFMRDFPTLRARLIALFPMHHHARIDQMSHEIVDVFTAYLRGLAKICVLYAFVAGMLFGILNVQYALLLGIMAGLFYAIPYVGNVMTAVSAATLAYLMDAHQVLFWNVGAHSLAYSLIVAICCVFMANIIFDQIVYPRVVGASVGLHPVVSIFALMAGATLFGIWGMLLATPVAASLQIVLMCLFPKLAQKPPASLVDSPVSTA